MSKKDDQAPSTFPEKWAKVLKSLPEFKDIAESSNVEDLKKIIVECEGNIYTIEKDKESNVKLLAAKEQLKEMMAPYSDAKKVQMAKIQYALFLLEGKGVELDNKPDED